MVEFEIIELGAANEHRAVFQVPGMEVRERERYAVGADQDIGAPEERREIRYESELDRPVGEF
jgi:hypothetical protein